MNVHEVMYNEHNPFSICAYTYVPIYHGKAEEKCPFCGARYMPLYKGRICNICKVAEIGKQVTGLKVSEKFS